MKKWIKSCFLNIIRETDWNTVLLVLTAKFFILAFAAQSFQIIAGEPIYNYYKFLEIWKRWDAIAYLDIAETGYVATGDKRNYIAFFPLYPMLVRWGKFIFQDYLVSGFIVSGIASVFVGLNLNKLVALDYEKEIAQKAVWFLLIFPTAYFLHITFTESLFLALSISCILAARKNRWFWAGVLGQSACMTRLNGLILIPVLLIEIYFQFQTDKKWRWEWLWILFIPTGFLAYLLINQQVFGNLFEFMIVQKQNWGKSLDFPWRGIRGKIGDALYRDAEGQQMLGVQELVFVAIGFVCCVWSLFKLRLSYSVWMILNLLLFISTSWLMSVPRYTLVLFPMFILFALASKNFWLNSLITFWSIFFLAIFAATFVRGHWAF